MTIENALIYKEQAHLLLKAEKLPVGDLPGSLANFFAAIENSEVVGVAGLEIYGKYGLMRSIAVQADYRGKGIASKLIGHIESLGNEKRLTELYLLTETASGYFKNKGFEPIEREKVPAEIKGSSQFSMVCPTSAIIMKKHLLK